MPSVRLDPVYSVAKAFALKGRLLTVHDMEELAGARGLGELVERLRATHYSQAVSDLKGTLSAKDVEMALRNRLVEVHHSMASVSSRPELLKAYYMTYVGRNLKVVLKGKALGKPVEDVSAYVNLRAEELIGRRDVVVRALAAGDVGEAANALKGTQFWEEASRAVSLFKETGNLSVFDMLIDKSTYLGVVSAYRALPKEERKRLEPMVSLDVDGYNLVAALRSKVWDLPPSEAMAFIVEDGVRVDRGEIARIVDSKDLATALEEARRTPMARLVGKGEGAIRETERNILASSYRVARLAFLKDVLSMSVVVALVKLLQFEVENLALIAYGVENMVPKAEISSRLLL